MFGEKSSEYVIEVLEYPGDFVAHAYLRGRSMCNMVSAPDNVEPVRRGDTELRLCPDCVFRASLTIAARLIIDALGQPMPGANLLEKVVSKEANLDTFDKDVSDLVSSVTETVDEIHDMQEKGVKNGSKRTKKV